jgi:hypothetical protein
MTHFSVRKRICCPRAICQRSVGFAKYSTSLMPTPASSRDACLGRIGLLLWFSVAVPFAVLCFEVFVEYGRCPLFLGLYLAAVMGPSLVYLLVVRGRQWQGRYQDYRALAEGLRVQFFWAASGLPFAVSDNYLPHQTGTLGWIRLALRGPALDGGGGCAGNRGARSGIRPGNAGSRISWHISSGRGTFRKLPT